MSADIIVSILRRFKAQHSLRNCPLLFVYASIRAIDATLLTARYQDGGTPVVTDTNLLALDAALAELSHAWALAGQARKGLQDLLNKRHAQRYEAQSTASSSFACDVELAFTKETAQDAIYKTQCLKVPHDNFKMATSTLAFQTISNITHYDALDSTDPTFWDPLGVMDDGTGSWSSGR
jgi:hypothetical protein